MEITFNCCLVVVILPNLSLKRQSSFKFDELKTKVCKHANILR